MKRPRIYEISLISYNAQFDQKSWGLAHPVFTRLYRPCTSLQSPFFPDKIYAEVCCFFARYHLGLKWGGLDQIEAILISYDQAMFSFCSIDVIWETFANDTYLIEKFASWSLLLLRNIFRCWTRLTTIQSNHAWNYNETKIKKSNIKWP